MTLSNSIFAVNDEPFCVWDLSLNERNLEFLEQFDSGYFEYIATTACNDLEDSEHKQHAALLMRQSLYHGLETLFSMLGALIQAPDCVYGWILKYKPGDIPKIVERINLEDNLLPRKLVLEKISWKALCDKIFIYSNPDPSEAQKNADNFAKLWRRLAIHYLEKENEQEYNGIKHGFRIRSGGFELRVGIQNELGVPCPPEKMQTISYSEFGSSFFTLEKVPIDEKANRSYRSRKKSLNWNAEQVALLLQLVSMSLRNVIATLKIVNGVPATKVQFTRPEESEAFERPWQLSTGIINFSSDYSIDLLNFEKTTKQELEKEVRLITEACKGYPAI